MFFPINRLFHFIQSYIELYISYQTREFKVENSSVQHYTSLVFPIPTVQNALVPSRPINSYVIVVSPMIKIDSIQVVIAPLSAYQVVYHLIRRLRVKMCTKLYNYVYLSLQILLLVIIYDIHFYCTLSSILYTFIGCKNFMEKNGLMVF